MMILPKMMIFPKISPEYPSDVVTIRLLPTNRLTNSLRYILPFNKVLLTSLLCFYFGLIFPDSLLSQNISLGNTPTHTQTEVF